MTAYANLRQLWGHTPSLAATRFLPHRSRSATARTSQLVRRSPAMSGLVILGLAAVGSAMCLAGWRESGLAPKPREPPRPRWSRRSRRERSHAPERQTLDAVLGTGPPRSGQRSCQVDERRAGSDARDHLCELRNLRPI